MADITIILPPKNKPGHLKRQKAVFDFQSRMQRNDPSAIDDMVSYVLKEATVTGPPGVDLREAIMELSEDEFNALFKPADTVPPTNAA